MFIREYQPSDLEELTKLFYNTVHKINAKDYTKEQLDVWAPEHADLRKWSRSFKEHYSIVAIDDEIIVGFGDIDRTGYLDRLYVLRIIRGKGLLPTFAIGWSRQLKEISLLMRLLLQDRFLKKEGIKL